MILHNARFYCVPQAKYDSEAGVLHKQMNIQPFNAEYLPDSPLEKWNILAIMLKHSTSIPSAHPLQTTVNFRTSKF